MNRLEFPELLKGTYTLKEPEITLSQQIQSLEKRIRTLLRNLKFNKRLSEGEKDATIKRITSLQEELFALEFKKANGETETNIDKVILSKIPSFEGNPRTVRRVSSVTVPVAYNLSFLM